MPPLEHSPGNLWVWGRPSLQFANFLQGVVDILLADLRILPPLKIFRAQESHGFSREQFQALLPLKEGADQGEFPTVLAPHPSWRELSTADAALALASLTSTFPQDPFLVALQGESWTKTLEEFPLLQATLAQTKWIALLGMDGQGSQQRKEAGEAMSRLSPEAGVFFFPPKGHPAQNDCFLKTLRQRWPQKEHDKGHHSAEHLLGKMLKLPFPPSHS